MAEKTWQEKQQEEQEALGKKQTQEALDEQDRLQQGAKDKATKPDMYNRPPSDTYGRPLN